VIEARGHSFFDAMKDRGIVTGMVVTSKRGHDTGRIYVVVSEHESFLALSDGSSRSLTGPKKKRRTHVRPLGQIENAGEWLQSISKMQTPEQNSEIRKGIRKFLDGHTEV